MKVIPNRIADETGADPAILDPKRLHCGKQLHDIWLLPKELGYLVAIVHVGQVT
jgi:hypothetical protein